RVDEERHVVRDSQHQRAGGLEAIALTLGIEDAHQRLAGRAARAEFEMPERCTGEHARRALGQVLLPDPPEVSWQEALLQMGTDGFEFVEYTAPDPQLLRSLFERLGFPVVARHRSKNVTLHRQGEINFIINAEPASFAQEFARAHGPSACAMAFRVRDAAQAYSRALALGAQPGPQSAGPMELNIPCIEGIGGSLIYLVDLYGERSIYDVDFRPVAGGVADSAPAEGAGLTLIDHLTHNVGRGRMDVWAGFYQKLFSFREIRYFDIEGKRTGLLSRPLTSPCGKIRIPTNES